MFEVQGAQQPPVACTCLAGNMTLTGVCRKAPCQLIMEATECAACTLLAQARQARAVLLQHQGCFGSTAATTALSYYGWTVRHCRAWTTSLRSGLS